jgi:hypothetical protein
MAPNSSEITVAAAGTIYVANISGTTTTYPTTVRGTLAALYQEMGYATEDGVTFSVTPDVTDIAAWQSATPVRRLTTSRTLTVATSLLQWNEKTFPVAFGGGSWSNDGTTYTFLPPADEAALAEFAVIVDAEDGTRKQRWIVERTNVTEAVETNLTRTGAAVLPITFSALNRSGEVRAWKFLTDDTQFA